jgi:serine/threonine protein kinase
MTILEMGLGKYPFQSETHDPPLAVRPIELVQCIVYETTPVLPANRGYSSEFASLIQQCLAKNPIDRPLPKNFFENPLLMKYNNDNTHQNRVIVADFFNRTIVAIGTS